MGVVRITEIAPPGRCSGLSSFVAEFPYDAGLTEAMRGVDSARWDRGRKAWEFPAFSLRDALDRLCLLAPVELRLLPDEAERPVQPPLTDEEIKAFRAKPFRHQIEGVDFMLSKGRSLLLDSMGLGKSLEIIMLAETLKRRGLIDKCLIVCGVDSLRQNWKNEIERFSSCGCRVLGERTTKSGSVQYATVRERAEELGRPIDAFFVVVNAAALRDQGIAKALSDPKSPNRFGMIACDEAHRFATKSSEQSAGLLRLKADWMVAATGTPLMNSPLSCYMPLSWIGADRSGLTEFKREYCVGELTEFGRGAGARKAYVLKGFRNLGWLKEELGSVSIRRTLDQVKAGMPPKSIETVSVEMGERQRRLYDAVRKGVREEVDKVDLKPGNLLALATRLRQATSAPGALTSEDVGDCKADEAERLARELAGQGEKCVLMCSFRETARALAGRLRDLNPVVGDGDVPDPEVQKGVDAFQKDPSRKVFVATYAKMGTGYTLNAASWMICLDTPYTWAAFSQGTDRIWRVTNERPAFVRVLLCQGTADARVWGIVQRKKGMSDALIDGKASPSLSDDLREMLSGI